MCSVRVIEEEKQYFISITKVCNHTSVYFTDMLQFVIDVQGDGY